MDDSTLLGERRKVPIPLQSMLIEKQSHKSNVSYIISVDLGNFQGVCHSRYFLILIVLYNTVYMALLLAHFQCVRWFGTLIGLTLEYLVISVV